MIFMLFMLFGACTIQVCSDVGMTRPTRSLYNIHRWFIWLDYEQDLTKPAEPMADYQLGILDADYHPPLDMFAPDMIKIAYISIGEAEGYRSYWDEIKNADWVIGENPNWAENYYVDISRDEWQDLLIYSVIPEILKKGFHGLMMDTLDTAAYLTEMDEERFSDAHAAMIRLVKAIRKEFPDIFLMSNNGFSILDEIAGSLDGLVVEDVFMMVDFDNGGYRPVPEEERLYKLSRIKSVRDRWNLPVYDIEYVDSNDEEMRAFCHERADELGFYPYVAEKDLDQIYAQPY